MIQKRVEIGPIHPWLTQAMRLELDLRGDLILSCNASFGYLSKEIEKKIVGADLVQAQRFLSRTEPESALILDRLISEAVEQSVGVKIGPRAFWVREVTSEISELNGALKYLASMARRLGIDVLDHILLKHREELLDLIELLSGSRYGYHFICPGGSRYDITDGFVERLEIWIKNFLADYPRIEAMYLWTSSMHNRLKSLGRVVDDGEMGFVSLSAVETTQYGVVSQVESRLVYALTQARELSNELLELLVERHPSGLPAPSSAELLKETIQKQSNEVEMDTFRGKWKLKVEFDKGLKIKSIQMNTPSDAIRRAISGAIEDEQYEDVPLILESLCLLVTEIDR